MVAPVVRVGAGIGVDAREQDVVVEGGAVHLVQGGDDDAAGLIEAGAGREGTLRAKREIRSAWALVLRVETRAAALE